MENSGKRLSDSAVLLSILDNLPTSIFVKDENLKFAYSNLRHCEMIGKPESELLGRGDADFYSEEVASEFIRHDKRVIQNGEVDVSEEWASLENGMKTPVLTRKARLIGPDSKTYLIGTNTDLTDIKKREDQYKALSETVPVGVVQIEEGGRITFSNPLFNAYCGGDGTSEAREAVLAMLATAHSDFPGVACKFETEFTALGRGRRSVIVISSGWIALGESARTAIVSIVDVSEMMELRQVNEKVSKLNRDLAANMKQLREAQDELITRGRMEQLGQLTATVAHELRNPLGSVRTSAYLLERKLKDKGLNVEAQLERINKGIVRCDNIITQLLDFSRNKQIQCTPSDLDQWLGVVLEEESKKLPAVVSISCELGLDGQDVPFDPARLQRAIVNLINNASEAMVGQGDDPAKYLVATPEISVRTTIDGEFAKIEVKDNGPGIAADVISRIREPLFTTKSFGTGLGIPAIEQIAMQHGGRLDISSDVGDGARFTVYLPLVTAQHIVEDVAA